MGSVTSSNNDKQFDTLRKKYFKSINQIIHQHYENCITQKRLNSNMSICLENKYFDEIYSSEESQSNKSQFFYKDFYMSSEPNCMRDPKNDTSVNNDIYEEPSLELRTSINNSNLNMMRALGGSIGPNAIIDDDNDNEINISVNEAADSDSKYKSYRNKVKKYIEIFKQHITYKDHPINKVIQIFEKTWVKYIKKNIERINNNDQSLEDKAYANNLIDNLIREFQNFIIKVQICQ